MIKKTVSIFLIILPFFMYSQKDITKGQKDSVIGFHKITVCSNIGFSIPLNGFYTQTVEAYGNSQFGSFADVGYTANIIGEISIFHSHFGIVGMCSFNTEIFNLQKCFATLYPASTSAGQEYSNYTSYQLTSSDYSNYKEILLMGGIYFSVGKKSIFDFRLMMGDNACKLAGYSMYGNSTTTTYVIYQGKPLTNTYSSTFNSFIQATNSSGIAYSLGIDCHFLQRKRIAGLLSCNFIYSRANFNTVYNTEPTVFQVNYYILDFTVGIGYKF